MANSTIHDSPKPYGHHMYSCKSPILLRVYNRPDKVINVLNQIAKIQPKKLYVTSDGANKKKVGDRKNVDAVRKLIDECKLDCEIHKLFWEENLGAPRSGFEGINWFFENEEQGIILEDDHSPSEDFFVLCDDLLERYKYSETVFCISGNNVLNERLSYKESYYFTSYFQGTGWASWSRAWKHSSLDIKFWPNFKSSKQWRQTFTNRIERKYWEQIFDGVYTQKKVHWDFAWLATILVNGGLVATPTVNLVKNIGFDENATNTKNKDNFLARIDVEPLGTIVHPTTIKRNKIGDDLIFDIAYEGKYQRFPFNIYRRLLKRLKCLIEV